MKNFVNKVQRFVSTQYGDLTGVIQLDGHDNISSIYELCKDYKFDLADKFIVGFGLGESTISGVGENDSVYFKIVYLNMSKYGKTFDEISSNIRNKETVEFISESFEIKFTDLKKYIKRFDFIALTEMAEFAQNIKIIEK